MFTSMEIFTPRFCIAVFWTSRRIVSLGGIPLVDGDGCKNSGINDLVKDIFGDSCDFNFSIQTFYIPSSHNPAEEPLRDLSDLDCMLAPETWLYLERFFGPPSSDLMSQDSNCQREG